MIKYLAKRIALLITTFIFILSLVYLLLSVSNYETWYRGFTFWEYLEFAWEDYMQYGKGILTKWDFGIYSAQKPVLTHVLEEIPTTLRMNLYALFFYVPLGLFFGILSARYHGTLFDKIIGVVTLVLGSVPGYITMLFLMLYFGYQLGWFPGRFDYYADDPFEIFMTISMPVLALSLGPISRITRILRGDLVEEMGSQYVELVRTKGFNQTQVLLRHALRNSVLPIITEIPRIFSMVLSMSFIIEITYNLRGAAFLFYESIITPSIDGSFLDVNVEAAYVICAFYIGLVMIMALLSDLSYALIDPRIKMGSKK